RDIGQLVDKDRTALAQGIDHKLVVYYLVTHVDGGAIDVQCAIDDIDGAIHAGTEAPGIGQANVGSGRLCGRTARNEFMYAAHFISSSCTAAGTTDRIGALKRISRPASG